MMSEPVTAITDYMLVIGAAYFGWWLWRAKQMAWALAFSFTAFASLFGGTYHAFHQEVLWKPTVYSLGLASMFLLIGAKPSWTVLAVLKFVIYATWMITHDDFKYVIIDYGITLVIVAIQQSVAWFDWRAESAPWIVGSILVSVFGAMIQQMEIGIHRYFNHNDLYHLIQLFALWLLYRGGLLLNRLTPIEPPMIQPT